MLYKQIKDIAEKVENVARKYLGENFDKVLESRLKYIGAINGYWALQENMTPLQQLSRSAIDSYILGYLDGRGIDVDEIVLLDEDVWGTL